MIEAFNARFRAECLNGSWFLSLEDAREKTDGWRRHYNSERPHSALGNLAPETFALVATAAVTLEPKTSASTNTDTNLAVSGTALCPQVPL